MTFNPTQQLGQIRKLETAEDWAKWKSDFKAMCLADETWDWLTKAEELPTEDKEKKAAEGKLRTIGYCLTMTCGEAARGLIDGKKTAIEMYDALKSHYEGDTPAKRMALRKSLFQLRHDPDTPVLQFINDIRSIVSDLTAINHKPDADLIRDIVLMNLDSSFEIIRTMLATEDKDNGNEWTLDGLSTRLTGFEATRVMTGEARFLTPMESANAARTGRFSNRNHHDTRHHHRSRSGDNWGNVNNIPGACTRCGHLHHDASTCFRDMPEHVKDRIRHKGSASANIAGTRPSSPLTNGPVNISQLHSAVSTGHTVTLWDDHGIVENIGGMVGKIHYVNNGFIFEERHIAASFAHAGYLAS